MKNYLLFASGFNVLNATEIVGVIAIGLVCVCLLALGIIKILVAKNETD